MPAARDRDGGAVHPMHQPEVPECVGCGFPLTWNGDEWECQNYKCAKSAEEEEEES